MIVELEKRIKTLVDYSKHNVATDTPGPAKEEEITIIPETSPSSIEQDIEQAISTKQPDEQIPEPEVFEGTEV